MTAFTTDPRRLVVGIGPAGAGKTTATAAALAVWQAAGRRVVPLASSAKAAQVLAADLARPAVNLHKYLHDSARDVLGQGNGGRADEVVTSGFAPLRPGDVVLLDEAGMAGTAQLHALLAHVSAAGAQLRLLGDPAQLAAVDAGGALRLLARDVGPVYLTTLHQFTDPAEAATVQLRAGDPAALDYYFSRNRVRAGSREAMREDAYAAWCADIAAGKRSVLIAATTTEVTALNARARADRIAAGQVTAAGAELADGTTTGVGDLIVTGANDRRLRTTPLRTRRGMTTDARYVTNEASWAATYRGGTSVTPGKTTPVRPDYWPRTSGPGTLSRRGRPTLE